MYDATSPFRKPQRFGFTTEEEIIIVCYAVTWEHYEGELPKPGNKNLWTEVTAAKVLMRPNNQPIPMESLRTKWKTLCTSQTQKLKQLIEDAKNVIKIIDYGHFRVKPVYPEEARRKMSDAVRIVLAHSETEHQIISTKPTRMKSSSAPSNSPYRMITDENEFGGIQKFEFSTPSDSPADFYCPADSNVLRRVSRKVEMERFSPVAFSSLTLHHDDRCVDSGTPPLLPDRSKAKIQRRKSLQQADHMISESVNFSDRVNNCDFNGRNSEVDVVNSESYKRIFAEGQKKGFAEGREQGYVEGINVMIKISLDIGTIMKSSDVIIGRKCEFLVPENVEAFRLIFYENQEFAAKRCVEDAMKRVGWNTKSFSRWVSATIPKLDDNDHQNNIQRSK